MFVPRTPGGELVTRLRQAEEEISRVVGNRIKLVERSGMMLKGILTKSNPHSGEKCGRTFCLVCNGGEEGGGDCRWRSVTYQTTCLSCLETGRKVRYYGESSRTAFERGVEHVADFISEAEESHMNKHQVAAHQGQDRVKFSMKVVQKHMSAFKRQVNEAVLIQLNEGRETLLNSKGEYNRCSLPRLTVKLGERELIELEDEVEIGKNRGKKKREKDREAEQPESKRRKKKQKMCFEVKEKRKRDFSEDGDQEKEESKPKRPKISRNEKIARKKVEMICQIQVNKKESDQEVKNENENLKKIPKRSSEKTFEIEENVDGTCQHLISKKNAFQFPTTHKKPNVKSILQIFNDLAKKKEFKPPGPTDNLKQTIPPQTPQ